jgi:hypothetical protein
MKTMSRLALAVLMLATLWAGPVRADERMFGYVYEAEVLPKGAMEFEQWVTNRNGKAEGIYSAWDLREEFEVGLTDSLTTALYLNTKSVYESVYDSVAGMDISTEEFAFEGLSSEWKYLFLSPQEHWLGAMAYMELGYNGPELEVEAKLIFEHRFSDDFIWAVNFMVENEYEYQASQQALEGKCEFTTGFSYRLTPSFALGVEARNHREFPNSWEYQEHSAWFAGPNLHVASGKWWGTLSALPQVGGQPETIPGDGRVLDEHERVETRLVFGVNF